MLYERSLYDNCIAMSASKKRKVGAVDLLAGNTVKSDKVFASMQLTRPGIKALTVFPTNLRTQCSEEKLACRKFCSRLNVWLQVSPGNSQQRAQQQPHCHLTAKRCRPYLHAEALSHTMMLSYTPEFPEDSPA